MPAIGVMDLGSVESDWELQTQVGEVDVCSDNLIIRIYEQTKRLYLTS